MHEFPHGIHPVVLIHDCASKLVVLVEIIITSVMQLSGNAAC